MANLFKSRTRLVSKGRKLALFELTRDENEGKMINERPEMWLAPPGQS